MKLFGVWDARRNDWVRDEYDRNRIFVMSEDEASKMLAGMIARGAASAATHRTAPVAESSR